MTSENIQLTLVQFCQWANLDPLNFSADCALNICSAIERGFPMAHLSWCALHVLKAIEKQAALFKTRDNFEMFYLWMDYLTFRATEKDAKEQSEAVYDEILSVLEQEPKAKEYF